MHKNGQPMLDTQGNPIHAHGGHMLRHGEFWYWYGEDRRGDDYVACYRSADLHNWERRGAILSADSPCAPARMRTDLTLRRADGGKVNIERPKVLYSPVLSQFVMWAHYENGVDYSAAAACIATSDTPDGEFTYRGSFRPFGHMSRDCTLFLDDDGTAYFLSASRDNADLKMYRLAPDFLNVEAEVSTLFPGEYREAPAVFKRDGRYYMLSSFCTGWAPNQGKYSVADRMDGRWSLLSDFGDATTFDSQPAFVQPLADGRYIYIGDRWCGGGEKYFDSTYVILEIHFTESGEPWIEFEENAAL